MKLVQDRLYPWCFFCPLQESPSLLPVSPRSARAGLIPGQAIIGRIRGTVKPKPEHDPDGDRGEAQGETPPDPREAKFRGKQRPEG